MNTGIGDELVWKLLRTVMKPLNGPIAGVS